MTRRNAKESRRVAGPGWFATIGGGVLLVVVGFGVGLVAGAAFEEPDLVVGHLVGRTTGVPLPGSDRWAEISPQEPPPVGAAQLDLIPRDRPFQPDRVGHDPLCDAAESEDRPPQTGPG